MWEHMHEYKALEEASRMHRKPGTEITVNCKPEDVGEDVGDGTQMLILLKG